MLQGSRDSVVGVATPYEFDGPDLEPWWGARFLRPIQTGREVHSAYCTTCAGAETYLYLLLCLFGM